MHATMRNFISEVWEDDAMAAKICKRKPGRGGRWLSIVDVEDIIEAVTPDLGRVWKDMFGVDATATRAAGPGADEQDDFLTNIRYYKNVAVQITNSHTLRIMVLVSVVAKSEVSRFMRWQQKRMGEINELSQECLERTTTYLGPTLLSDFICFREDARFGENDALDMAGP